MDGIYTVNFVNAVVSGSAVTGSSITAGDVPSGMNVVANGLVYEIKEGDFVVSGTYNNRTIVPATGNVTVKKDVPTVTVGNTEIVVTSGTIDKAIKDQLGTNDNGKYTILDVNVANNNTTGSGRRYVLLRSIRVAEKRADGKFVIHTIDMNRYFSVTVQ